jgi:hypothetical protein
MLTLAVCITSGILLGSLAFWVAEVTEDPRDENHHVRTSADLDYTDPDLIIPPRADNQE